MFKERNVWILKAIFQRASVRSFQAKPVEEEKMERMLRAAMAAPSAGNQQPWEFYVVSDPALLAQLAQCSPYAGCVKNAPVAIIACYDTVQLQFPECVLMDMSAATENILLEAAGLGVGTVWLGIAPLQERMTAVRRVLSLPEGQEAFAIIPCGYPTRTITRQDRYRPERVHRIG